MPEMAQFRLMAIPGVQLLQAAPSMAFGAKLHSIQNIVLLEADSDAPRFAPGFEPTQDARTYSARDGKGYFRPELTVAQRNAPLSGPDVCFLESQDGTIRLQMKLDEHRPECVPAGAVPFNTRVSQARLEWTESGTGKQHVFPVPTLIAEDTANDSHVPDFSLVIGQQLESAQLEAIHRAMTTPGSDLKIVVDMKFGYFLEEASSTPGPLNRHPSTATPAGPVVGRISGTRTLSTAARPAVVLRSVARPMSTVSAAERVEAPKRSLVSGIRLERTLDPAIVERIMVASEERKNNVNYREATITRRLPFAFDPSLEQNRHIYRAISADDSCIEKWTSTLYGLVKKSSFPNTVYRIPDEMRLIYNTELGSPYLVPSLYRDAEENVRVRVTFRLAPWHDPEKIIDLREDLEKATGGMVVNPTVITGGYVEARLRLTSAFPEQVTSISDEEPAISIENGTDLTLDVTLEFYRYIASLLTGPVGLTGEVSVTLEAADGGGVEGSPDITQKTTIIPVRISLDDLTCLPIDLTVEADSISPRKVVLKSRAHGPVEIENCSIHLLQWDENSMTPLASLKARSVSTFPLTLEAGTDSELQLVPEDESTELIWNAVQVDLLGASLQETPEECLARINELSPSASLSWTVTADCPLFHQEPIAEAFKNLYQIEILVTREGYDPKQVLLGPGVPTMKIPMDRSLKEILSSDADGTMAFKYKVRNLYFDHQGSWGEEVSAEGLSFFPYPNQVEGD